LTLLAYARNRDPVVRAGAIEALTHRMVSTAANSALFEIGLRDADVRVRSAALDALILPTRADLGLLAAFARNAPTPEERRNARAHVNSYKSYYRPFR